MPPSTTTKFSALAENKRAGLNGRQIRFKAVENTVHGLLLLETGLPLQIKSGFPRTSSESEGLSQPSPTSWTSCPATTPSPSSSREPTASPISLISQPSLNIPRQTVVQRGVLDGISNDGCVVIHYVGKLGGFTMGQSCQLAGQWVIRRYKEPFCTEQLILISSLPLIFFGPHV
jgi:hypothetical protein